MSDTFVYIYMYVCIYRSIVINNITQHVYFRSWVSKL